MPNHVDQDLWVKGDTKSLNEFIEFAQEGQDLLSANKFIPYPEKYKVLDESAKAEHEKGNYMVKDGFNSGGYDWCVQNWGTKWGIYHSQLVSSKLGKNKGSLRYRFDSAWSPAKPIIFAMSKRFPSLEFKLNYYECGMAFKGTYVVKGGEILSESSGSYHGPRGG